MTAYHSSDIAIPRSIAQAAIDRIVGECNRVSVAVQPSQHGHGHYSAPLGFVLARHYGQSPSDVAQHCASLINDERLIATATGGFVNVTLTDEYLLTYAQAQSTHPYIGQDIDHLQTVVIDYSGPNIAKTMHVGHLRSTIIGDALVRMYAHAGHTVIKQNHVGDWGTQFGMLVEALIEQASMPESLDELNAVYQAAKQRFDEDEDFAQRSRTRVTLLQGGDQVTTDYWKQLVAQSHYNMHNVYQQLGVALTNDDIRGESAYNSKLPNIVQQLLESGVAQYDNGAVVVFVPGYTNREGTPLPLLIQKSDGGYLYSTTDLAAIIYRHNQLHADSILYVTDSRQADRFDMLFQTSSMMQWNGNTGLYHVPFGSVIDSVTKKPFKTREGDAISLQWLIDQADEQAIKELQARHSDWDIHRIHAVNHEIALAAIKYADLSNDRENDYVFDIDTMVSFEGDTGPYLQYTAVRLSSIIDKEQDSSDTGVLTVISNDQERDLILMCAQWHNAFAQSLHENKPHIWARYLHQLAVAANQFYHHSPIKKETGEIRQSRLVLAGLAQTLLSDGMGLLGITQPQEM